MKSKVLSTTFSLALGVACAATAAAAKYNVLPIDDSGTERLDPSTRPSLTHGRTEFTYFGAVTHAPTGN